MSYLFIYLFIHSFIRLLDSNHVNAHDNSVLHTDKNIHLTQRKPKIAMTKHALLCFHSYVIIPYACYSGLYWMQNFPEKKLTRAKDVLPNINRTQAPEITPDSNGMVPSAADARCLQPAHTIRTLPGVTEVLSAFLFLVTLTLTFKPV